MNDNNVIDCNRYDTDTDTDTAPILCCS
ncbi:hypothetical protein DFA_05171 [Cavenderia fasciculata]|uniref:Uncharacterized protein n=1 Tax=Cavenderia fasciculata TaxID=261658 RepID=F4PNI8_CACFS|nr:hypothetical protein DFA_05171 [Cavenderia fasciculata]EGG23041.1 hypothetical protein DFA_05171 [Cavenderia fasciculata]|eukprot:XP_004360892.1 hypothetical protein DFA_05171 [Cavenderia fasciculata]